MRSLPSRRPGIERLIAFAFLWHGAATAQQLADEPEELEAVDVIGVTPTHGVGLPADKVPGRVQIASSEDLQRQSNLDLSDHLNRNFGSVSIDAAQTNVLQPDVQYRGFTASPLLGLPQGLAVYVNGVRVNEAFGDTVNWDLLPPSIISSVNLIGGTNPVFGLNALGGALSLRTKDGFSHPGYGAEVYGGSFGRIVTNLEAGASHGGFGYFLNARHFAEDGWRDSQPSDAINLYGTIGWRSPDTTLDLQYFHAVTNLTGNGPLPVEQLEVDRASFFTAPDITRNGLRMLNLEGSHWLSNAVQVSGNAFVRSNRTRSFNGDGTPFEECELAEGEFLIEDDDGFACDGSESLADLADDQQNELVRDGDGNPVDGELDAVNNRNRIEQLSFGGNVQTTLLHRLLGGDNQLVVGLGFHRGQVEFRSSVEAAALDERRVTRGAGIFLDDEATSLDASTQTWSAYLTDTWDVTDDLSVTLAGRYNDTNISTDNAGDFLDEDADGVDDLSGDHDLRRFNPAVGVTWQALRGLGLYASYSESSRTPTPVELACADPDAPCLLPNAFLADPPLDQVVARSVEAGARGRLLGSVHWSVGGFHTTNADDILFLSTGGVTSNQGYFDNVGDTRRLGLELGIGGQWGPVRWLTNYGFVHATFADGFVASSPNHPLAVDGEIQVRSGDRIPGVPQHSLKLSVDYAPLDELSLGLDANLHSGQFLRGDEANVLDPSDGYAVVQVRARYRLGEHLWLFGMAENVLAAEYETFGLLGEADEVFPDFEDNRFLSPGAPISGWLGARIEL